MKKHLLLICLSVVLLALVACGGGGGGGGETAPEPEPVGDAANGEALFTQPIIGAAPGCITCHSLEPDVVIVGPSQAGLATRAETRVPGKSAEEYIRESIMTPDAYVVEGFTAGLMYQNYATDLTQEQIDDIVAYTLSLR
ncbi:Cytochrome c class I [Candidatus Promineifilum breve]|uniref:Cytochrome c class I n=1 Tax=Candidatus Promineifilum breve TaxID=1806508 RepID=A0A160SZX2_9CHLR|nr:cytochrome c [Candidatus Promineifilum breve]CUS02309.2 Cytochrome c class I [Candidatus Promineifilum breve]